MYTLSFKFTTKNTNSGVVIQSYDANGAYIENTMHKTGLGDVVKFTFTTHANATKVHICNNAAYGGETIQLDEIMLIEGDQTALDIPFFEGMKSVELVRPLTNLFTNDTSMYAHNTTVTNSGGTVTVTSTAISQWASAIYYLDLKPNTKYVIMWDGLTFTQTSSGIDYIISVCENDTIFSHMGNKFTTLRSIIFDTGDKSAINIRIHATLSNTETGTTTVTGLRVFEYDDYLRSVDLQSIGYFSGTKNVAVKPIKTCSKNLYPYGDINFTPTSTGWFDAKGNSQMTGDIASKSHSRFLLKKGTYYFSIGSNTNAFCQLTDDKENMGVNANSSFTLQEDKYVTLRVKVTTANTSATVTNIQIERGETATAYVAHDSRYYEPDGQNAIVLRSLPSGVCDTFNLQTGEYTRRIGEIIIDGSEDWTLSTKFSSTYNSYYFALNETYRKDIKYVNDKYQLLLDEKDLGEKIGIYMGSNQGKIAPFISSDKMTLSEFKEYLQSNPITVQYQLSTPVTTIIPRTIKRNNNGTVSTVDFGTYTNKESLVLPKNPSYLTINSMTSIKPVVEPITYIDFKTRLKANTDYSIIMDKNSTDKTINLGGTSKTYTDKMLVRTPSIDLEQNLRISGSGTIQNIMVIEGDVLDKELPYFNGMCNVKMPIIRNTGKNLFNIQSIYQGLKNIAPNHVLLLNDNTLQIKSTGMWHKKDLGKPIKFKENTRYTLSFYAKDIDNTGSLPDTLICFVYADGTTSYSRTWGDNVSTSAAGKTVDYINFSFGRGNGKMIEFSNFMLVEGTEAQLYEPYKENSVYAVQGEIRLTPDMFEQGNFGADASKTYEENKNNGANRYRTKSLIKVEPNTTYEIRYTEYYSAVYEYGKDEKKLTLGYNINKSTLTITTSNNCYYLAFSFVTSTLPTQCISIIKVSEIVQLRSLPNGVKDELNLLTGEYIQRVGEIVLDGSENYWYFRETNTNTVRITNDNLFNASKDGGINDTFYQCNQQYQGANDVECLCIRDTLTGVGLRINKTKLTTPDANGLRQWLSENPVTVQYELAEPIISYPRIVSNTQEREVGVKLPNGVCDTYNPSTGITVKRVGKAILDGSEDWALDTTKTNTQVFKMPAPKDFAPTYNNLITESLPTTDGTGSDTEKIAANQSTHSTTTGLIWCMYIALLKTKASTVSELKTYLASNPITVWYELKNPIVTTDIVLPNGVHDEYNPLTGLYTKRVGFIEFDGRVFAGFYGKKEDAQELGVEPGLE